jgi:hypothetical protein
MGREDAGLRAPWACSGWAILLLARCLGRSHMFRSEQADPPVRKDRASKKYSLTGGFLKIVRQNGKYRFRSDQELGPDRRDRVSRKYSFTWRLLENCVERRDHSICMVGLTRQFARMSNVSTEHSCLAVGDNERHGSLPTNWLAVRRMYRPVLRRLTGTTHFTPQWRPCDVKRAHR